MYVAANFFPYTIGSIIDVGSIRYFADVEKE